MESPLPYIVGLQVSLSDFDQLGIHQKVSSAIICKLDGTTKLSCFPKNLTSMIKQPFFNGILIKLNNFIKVVAQQNEEHSLKHSYDSGKTSKSIVKKLTE